jgi:hypothetical protein
MKLPEIDRKLRRLKIFLATELILYDGKGKHTAKSKTSMPLGFVPLSIEPTIAK